MVDLEPEMSGDGHSGDEDDDGASETSSDANFLADSNEDDGEPPSFYAAARVSMDSEDDAASEAGGAARSDTTGIRNDAGPSDDAQGGRPAFGMDEFRTMLSDEEGTDVFMAEASLYEEDRLLDFISMVRAGLLDAHPADLMADIFGLYIQEPGDASADDPNWKMAECWRTVNEAPDVSEIYVKVNKRNVATISRLHAVIARIEMKQMEGHMWELYEAIARVFTMRESICSVLESRVPRKERSAMNKLSLMIRLSNGSAELTDHQRLLIILSNKWHVSGVRRGEGVDDGVYVRQKTPDGHDTHYWQRCTTIAEWVAEQTSTRDPVLWGMATRDPNTRKKIVDHIIGSSSSEFPVRPRDRHVFAFKNGIYKADTDEFFEYPAQQLSDDIGACRYFDAVDMPLEMFEGDVRRGDYDTGGWQDILVEPVTKILDDQQYNADVKKAFWALAIGRMLYNLKEVSNMEVMVFLKGIAGSGKSTLVKIVELMYGEDAGLVSNNIESLFGLSQHISKYVIYSYELNESFSLTQSEFLSLVSGERLTMARKHKEAISQSWKAPFLAAGNRAFWKTDNASAVFRRLILFPFDKKPSAGQDTRLDRRIERDIGLIIVKGNRAYRSLVNKLGDREVHDILPEMFMAWRSQAQESTNPLMTFLTTVSWVLRHPDNYVPWEIFQRKYQEWLRARDSRARSTLDDDYYKHVFTEFRIRVVFERVTKTYPRNTIHRRRCFYVYGVDFDMEGMEGADYAANNNAAE